MHSHQRTISNSTTFICIGQQIQVSVEFLRKINLIPRCTTLLSNAVAIRLLLKVGITQKVKLPSVSTVILLGDRVSSELLTSIEKVMPNAKKIAVGMLFTVSI